jgi:tetratricopeptide (TPR) repeat protein
MKQAGSIPTPYIDEQTFMLSRDLISYALAGQLNQVPHWEEMVEHNKQLTSTQNAQHPLNTNARFIYARFLHEIAPYLPKDQQMSDLAQAETEYRAAIGTSPKRQQLYYSLARLYDMVGQKDQARQVLQAAVDFDQNVGDSWWYLGITDWFDFNDLDKGMDEVVKAATGHPPYAPQQARDALFIAQAAAAKNRQDVLNWLLPQLPRLGGGSAQMFLDIARAYEKAGMTDERNALLNAVQQADPSIAPQLEGLRNGSATSIDASIAMAPKSTSTPPTSPTTPSITPPGQTISTPPASTTPSMPGSGPRAR